MTATRKIQSPAKRGTLRAGEVRAAISEIMIPFDEIAKRAYEKFAARGFAGGFHEQDWFDAEDELSAEYHDKK